MRIPDSRSPLESDRASQQRGQDHFARAERGTHLPGDAHEGGPGELAGDFPLAVRGRIERRVRGERQGKGEQARDSQAAEDPASASVLPRLDVPDVIAFRLGLFAVLVEPRDIGLAPEVILGPSERAISKQVVDEIREQEGDRLLTLIFLALIIELGRLEPLSCREKGRRDVSERGLARRGQVRQHARSR